LGTLVAFVVVSTGVIVLRRTRPDIWTRGFRVPFYPALPLLSVFSCIYLIYNLNPTTCKSFAVWLVLAAILYFTYSIKSLGLRWKNCKNS
jgi:basic amino acid/polyamine antiporter, APA family